MKTRSECMNCINPSDSKESFAEPRVQKPPGSMPGSRKGHGMASKLVNGVTTAYFSSLELCNCVNVGTKDDSDNNERRPLIKRDDGSHTQERREEGRVKKTAGIPKN
ncbi:hypothetical protein Vadar_024373 [Vaccinium darrowii]|uniref:Uncharacterized protein n=1 Tax=Vaccinium darrowii TaxID=229202 RepID=A0ACB7YHV6_9ERIC|nr:hypothetical protein Vadar_024373 [Vaccinium darrowii]